MKFTTVSGSEYELTDIEPGAEGGSTATLFREGVPLADYHSGLDMEGLPVSKVFFAVGPEVGESFCYNTATHGWCLSTAVDEVTE